VNRYRVIRSRKKGILGSFSGIAMDRWLVVFPEYSNLK
jgi:hypothetical protein